MKLGTRRRWGVIVVALTLTCLPAASAGATGVTASGPFCERSIAHDHRAALRKLPKLHAPPASGRLGFAPGKAILTLSPQLVVGEGRIGYGLSPPPGSGLSRVRWDLTTTLTKVDWRGRAVKRVERRKRRLDAVRRQNSPRIEFEVGEQPGAYRLTIVFRDRSGRKLGGYGAYFRVVERIERARLGIYAHYVAQGDPVLVKVENPGTATLLFGLGMRIERREGEAWTEAPESPRGPVPAIGFALGPGLAGDCESFTVPTTMPPGEYRAVKEVGFGVDSGAGEEGPVAIAAAFQVVAAAPSAPAP
jgi:hypothetical protein